MKKVYLIGGTMGVGKTTLCQILKNKLRNSVFLDGDWCWDMHSFQVTQETKRMVHENIAFLLNNFIHCSVYDHILFCWVMHEQEIIDQIISMLDIMDCEVIIISLICSKEVLEERLQRDVDAGIRTADAISRSLERISLYDRLNTIKIDLSAASPEQGADQIIQLANRKINDIKEIESK